MVLFADLQAGIVELNRTMTAERLRLGVASLARLARLFRIPVIVSGIAGEEGSPANMIPEITETLDGPAVHHRTTCDSLLNEAIRNELVSTGRKTLLISGVATELAVQLPALTARDLGYNVYAVVDACGGVSERTEQAALSRMTAAGVRTLSAMTLAGEICGDFRTTEAQAAIGIVFGLAKG